MCRPQIFYLLSREGGSGTATSLGPPPDPSECIEFVASLTTRHTRRHRRHALKKSIDAIHGLLEKELGGAAHRAIVEAPSQDRVRVREAAIRSSDAAHRAWRTAVLEARCLLARSADGELAQSLEAAVKVAGPFLNLDARRSTPSPRRLAEQYEPERLRRLGRFHEAAHAAEAAVAASSSRRITRGLGVFAGADFACDRERNAFVGAPWSRGACLILCEKGSTATAPRCAYALKVCEAHPECATVDINVEASVATLKRETPLSSRTSRVKNVAVTHAQDERAVGRDGPCVESASKAGEVALRALRGRQACVYDCPQL